MNYFNIIYIFTICLYGISTSYALKPILNNKFNNNFVKMTYHYYVYKNLNIYYKNYNITNYQNNGCNSIINLDVNKCYYWYPIINNYDTKYNKDYIRKYLKEQLRPKIRPITIYYDNKFKYTDFENKYKKLIELQLLNDNKKWDDIVTIVKEECRKAI
jgi:hypothetical protein